MRYLSPEYWERPENHPFPWVAVLLVVLIIVFALGAGAVASWLL